MNHHRTKMQQDHVTEMVSEKDDPEVVSKSQTPAIVYNRASVVPLQVEGAPRVQEPSQAQQLSNSISNFLMRNKIKLTLLGFLGLACFIFGIVIFVQATQTSCPVSQKEKYDAERKAGNSTKRICCNHNLLGRNVKQSCNKGGSSSRSGSGRSSSGSGSGRRSSGRRSSGGGSSSGCFAPNSLVLLKNYEHKYIQDLELGDILVNGGVVESVMQVWGDKEPLYDVDGVVVSGSHAILDPYDQVWKRVIDVEERTRLLRTEAVLWNVVTSDHQLVLKKPDGGGTVMAADYMEAEESNAMRQASLTYLNEDIYNLEDALQVEFIRNLKGSKEPSRRLRSCFPPDTLLVLEDGVSTIRIDEVQVGSQVAGGLVQAVMKLVGEHEPLYEVEGVAISQFHSVIDPVDKVWRHAEHVIKAKKLDYVAPVLFNLITDDHRMHVTASQSGGVHVEVTDFLELDEDDELLDWNLLQLNQQEQISNWIRQ